MSNQFTLTQARAFYESLDPVQRHLMNNAFSDAFKAKLRDDMTPAELQDASDAAFIEAMRALSGNA